MSFLNDIQLFSKQQLKKTDTRVLTADGRQLVEKRNKHGRVTVEQTGTSGLGFVGDYSPDLQVAEIIPGLFMSSQDVSADLDLLNTHNITHILNLASMCNNVFEDEDLFTYKSVDILDLPTEDISNYFNECFQFMDCAFKGNVKSKVLVHCNAGVSRSATIVIAYLMKTQNMGFEEAFDLVKSKRSCIRPNDGFMQTLRSYKPQL